MDNDEVISTLNDLIETCKDGEEGFLTCARDVGDTALKSFFSNRAQTCAASALELQDLVRAYGGEPEHGSSLGGALHRRWVDVKSVIAGNDVKAVLKECERGEDVAVSRYRNALEKGLPAAVRAVVERQYQGVLKNHDQVRSLRDQYRSA
ncbi:PA2169 family four-helix-bundle protein [Noviherbaspirillum sp. UKPF54]|uniref:PA2169 family four-helix-bundle protein n=1 Tax=Noviherbaspirillum sp. UKPF54 TaxID=2601898 RepID=UPI0011B1BC4C|nr:PA2169 family four-helix-bundle protein [Noviherbaspirillum sp. UKPF54]QDZ29452.1 PA2169 family four-helix-bundle protein [Noviherbaspirillum sp. UKPF54]